MLPHRGPLAAVYFAGIAACRSRRQVAGGTPVSFLKARLKAASELLRVTRSGGKIGLANWTPESFIGRLFRAIGAYIPPAPGVKSPALWGTELEREVLALLAEFDRGAGGGLVVPSDYLEAVIVKR